MYIYKTREPTYNGVQHSWMWLNKEFTEWFIGVMSNKLDPRNTPQIRAITAKDNEQAFTEYIREVGEFLINIAEDRENYTKKVRSPQLRYSDIELSDTLDDYDMGFRAPKTMLDV